ncbi:MAG: DUF6055 domain-containing protein [Rhodocyclaceae bacterium]
MTMKHLLGVLASLCLVTGSHAATDYPSGYTKCVQNTGATCSFSGTRSVALGKSGSFVYGTFTNSVVCSSSNFPSNSFTTSAWCSYAGSTTSSSSSAPASSSSSSKASSSVASSVASSSSSKSSSSSSVSSSKSSSSVASSVASSATSSYAAVTSQYVYRNITTSNALYKDSAHFRVYYGGSGKTGGGILGSNSSAQVTEMLDYLESAYDYWVVQRGFRSPGRPVNGKSGGPFKMNVYTTNDLDAGGAMGYDANAGLPYLIVHTNQVDYSNVYVHEFGHCITLSEYLWVDKGNTGAWWETLAQWHTDTFLAFASQHATVAARYGQPTTETIINLDSTISQSRLTLVHADNRYEAWPFFSYISANPDNISGLGANAVRTMYRSYQGTETPLHTVARMSSTSWQRVVGNYWARMAYMDINHPLAQQQLFNNINNSTFRANSYRNLSTVATNTYRVISSRQPMYGGANINPLTVTGSGSVSFTVKNLGNGLSDSNFTATVAIRNTSNGSVRYVQLASGAGSVSIASGEEASLVVANTPNNLITYDAFASTSSSPEVKGLNYEVVIVGAKPRDL